MFAQPASRAADSNSQHWFALVLVLFGIVIGIFVGSVAVSSNDTNGMFV
jgi:hypothetical protein